MTDANSHLQSAHERRAGLAFGLACYGIWGVLPLFFVLLDYASPLEIVANRAIWSLLLCTAILLFRRQLGQVVTVLRNPRQLGGLAMAAALIGANWLAYVYAANHREVLQASLGYFINPLLTVLLGVMVLREKLHTAQWLAMGMALVAVTIITIGYGHPPWLALTLAGTFGLYGLAKSFAGRRTGAVASLTVETLLLSPLALIALAWLDHRGQTHFTTHGTTGVLLMLATGIITTTPLTFFAAAARRLPLSLVGMLQYIAPSLQFLIAVWVNHEAMPASRWIGFAIIWAALMVLSTDALRRNRRQRAARAGAAQAATR